MGLEEKLPEGILLTTVSKLLNVARSASVWPAQFGLACCAIEMMAVGGPRFDIARFGMERFSATPRQADLMIVAGRVSQKMAPVLRQIYDQMPEPKWVLAMGVCASSGGMFNNYAIVQGVDHVVPVDMYLPGCPPRPEMLLDAILKLHDKIRTAPISGKPEWTTIDAAPYDKPIVRDTRISKGLPVDVPLEFSAPLPGDSAHEIARSAPDSAGTPR
jgi:NADH-quinone oxidoreductase subunit B